MAKTSIKWGKNLQSKENYELTYSKNNNMNKLLKPKPALPLNSKLHNRIGIWNQHTTTAQNVTLVKQVDL